MSREARGALLTYVVGALLTVVIGLTCFVRGRNFVADRARGERTDALVGRFITQVVREGPASAVATSRAASEIVAAGIVTRAPETSTRYPFLRRWRYLAHTDADDAGRLVGAKAIHDLVSATLRGPPRVALTPQPASRAAPPAAKARRPLSRNHENRRQALPIPADAILTVTSLELQGGPAAAIVVTRPATPLAPLPATLWVVLLMGAALTLFISWMHRELRHIAAAILVGAVAVYVYRGLLLPLGEAATSWGGPSLSIAVAITVVLAILGVRGVGRRFGDGLREHRWALTYVTPALLGMGVLVCVPFVVGVGLAFFAHRHGHYSFVGFSNFGEVLSGGGHALSDPLNFYFTLAVTLLWTFLNVFFHATIGLGLALLMRQPWLKLRAIYRVLLIVPWAVPNYITALIWKGMFHQQYGAVNHVLGALGLEPVSWFSHFWTAFTANVVTNTWLGFPFMMVICLGALQSIPSDIYEAAEVDGASRWQQFTTLTLPLLRPALFPAIVLGCIWTFNQFNIIYLVSRGEPGGATNILVTEAYRWAFERGDRYGLAAAYAVLIFVVLLGWSWVSNRVSRASEGIYG